MNASVTTVSVTEDISGVNVPCYLLIGSELVYATAKGSGNFTSCDRGAGGTSAATHTNGNTVYVVYAANLFNQLKRAIVAIETELGAAPSGASATVVARSDALDTRIGKSLDSTGYLDFTASTELTIATGSVTPTQNWHTIDTEADSASDDLDTIVASGVTDGFILFVRANNTARSVVIKHNTGNIVTTSAADITLDETYKYSILIYDATLIKWIAFALSSGSGTYGSLFPEATTMLNGKISVSVASNNITVAIKTLAGTDPSSSDPVYVRIGDTVRSITAALSVTKNAGTNWFNAGASEHAATELDYFVYLLWNTTPATDIVDIGFARVPFFRVYSEASGTSTNEKYLAFGNASTPTSTDDMVNIGRFGATLSAGAGYTWTVPTFTTVNLIQRPIYETRWISWTPTFTGFSANPTNIVHQYKIIDDWIKIKIRHGTNGTSNSTSFAISAPFAARTVTNGAWDGMGTALDNSVAKTTPCRLLIASAASSIDVFSDMASATGWTNSGGKRIGTGFLDYPI